MRWNVLRKSVRNKALSSSARNLLVLAMDNETEEDEEQQGGAKNGTGDGVVVEMRTLGRIDSEAAVLDL